MQFDDWGKTLRLWFSQDENRFPWHGKERWKAIHGGKVLDCRARMVRVSLNEEYPVKKLTAILMLGSALLLGAVAGSGIAFASGSNNLEQNRILDHCQYLTLATNLAFPKKFGAKNTSVCVDIPVHVEKAKMVFNMDTNTVDGKGNSTGLKHMVMMGNVMKEALAKGQIKPENVDIIGIMHGSALKWLVKPVAPAQKKWIEAIFKLKREGVNIHLEACAAAMNGAHLTKKNLFSYDANGNPDPKAGGRIYVNQGAFARELYLQNHGYAYFEEGYNYHGKHKK